MTNMIDDTYGTFYHQCTCHPDERLDPCERKYAFSECLKAAGDRLRSELAAKDARIAELEDLQLEAKRIDLAASNIAFRRDNEVLRKELAEAKAALDLRERMALAETEGRRWMKERENELLAALEAANARWHDMVDVAKASGFDSLTDAITQAKAANARIAELEAQTERIDAEYSQTCQSADEVLTRAERAEAERRPLAVGIPTMEDVTSFPCRPQTDRSPR